MPYTYRIRITDKENVRVEKLEPDNKSGGEPPGKFLFENLPDIQILADKARTGTLKNPDEFGELLFKTLFDPVLQKDFSGFYEKARSANELLRIGLDIDESHLPKVAAIPWEFISIPPTQNQGKTIIATAPDMIFSRWRSQSAAPPKPILLSFEENLRIALAIAAPQDLGIVKYQEVHDALKKLCQTERIELLPLVNPANRKEIDEVLKQQPHIFHFIGHGRLKKTKGREYGEIALVDSIGRAEWIRDDMFSELFIRPQPGVVLLQACESGASSEAFAGVASRIVQQNIPVVLAMQFEISNCAATLFSIEFYKSLADNAPADKAAQEGRRRLSLEWTDKPDFATPVIFMRVRDGNVFQRQEQKDNPSYSLEEILRKLSGRISDIPDIYMPVAKYVKRIQKQGIDEDELFIPVIANFLSGKLKPEIFINLWKQRQAEHSKTENIPNYDVLLQRLHNGEIIPFLGSEITHQADPPLLSSEEMVHKLAQAAEYANFSGTLPMISQYYLMTEYGRNMLIGNIRDVVEPVCNVFQINPIYELLAKIRKPVMVISASYGNKLESAFQEKNKKYVTVSHPVHLKSEHEFGKILVKYCDKTETESHTQEAISGLPLLEKGYSIIYKICGCFHLCSDTPGSALDPMMLAEEDFLTFSRHIEKLIPSYLVKRFSNQSLLFLGCNLKDWHDRLIVNAILEKKRGRCERSYAVSENPSQFERAFWKYNGVDVYEVATERFIRNITGIR